MLQGHLKYFVFLFLISVVSCLEPYENNSSKVKEVIMVDAEISSKDSVHIVKISSSGEIGSQLFNAYGGAKVFLISKSGLSLQFIESNIKGFYKYTGKLNSSAEYKIEVIDNEANLITSEFQSFPKPFVMDSIEAESIYERTELASGGITQGYVVKFYIYSAEDQKDETSFLRFDLETVFIVIEPTCGPFHIPKTCFIYNQRSDLDINLLEIPKSNQPFSIKQKIFEKPLGYEFGGAFSVKADVKSYNKENYIYWQQFKNLFNQNGSVEDLIPATINSNLSSDGNRVLGLFSLISTTEVSKVVRRDQKGFQTAEPYCGTPGFFEPYPRPAECCNCLLFPNSTLLKPYYW